MYRNDGFRIFSGFSFSIVDGLFQKLWRHIPSFLFWIDEDGCSAQVGYRIGWCRKCERLANHFVSGTYSQLQKSQMNGCCTGWEGNDMSALSDEVSRSFSNALTLGPSGTTQLVSNASWMNCCSQPLIRASERWMRCFITNYFWISGVGYVWKIVWKISFRSPRKVWV